MLSPSLLRPGTRQARPEQDREGCMSQARKQRPRDLAGGCTEVLTSQRWSSSGPGPQLTGGGPETQSSLANRRSRSGAGPAPEPTFPEPCWLYPDHNASGLGFSTLDFA